MSILDSVNKSSDSATDLGKKYTKSSVEYIKLKSFYLSALSLSLVTKLVLIGGVFTLAFIFLLIAGAIALGDYLNNVALGYLSIACILFVIMFIIFLFRKSIDTKIIQNLSKKFFD